VRGFIRVTVWVSVAMIPIVASHFHRVGLYAIAANLALIPVTSLVVPSGLAASVLGSAIPWVADVLFYPVHLLLLLLTHGAQWIAALPHATIRVLPPSLMMLIALYSAADAWILLDRRKVLTRAAIGACAVVFGVSLTWNVLDRPRAAKQGELEIFFLDVGDADATFVRLPDGRTLLVDAAGRFSESFDVGKAVVVPLLETQWIRHLDYALLTHPERDHAGGLLAVPGSMSVGQLWESGLRSTNPLRGRVLRAAAARAVPLHRLRRGAKIIGRGYRIEVLHPSSERKTVGYRRDNDHSVVLRLVHGRCASCWPRTWSGAASGSSSARGKASAPRSCGSPITEAARPARGPSFGGSGRARPSSPPAVRGGGTPRGKSFPATGGWAQRSIARTSTGRSVCGPTGKPSAWRARAGRGAGSRPRGKG